MQTYRYAWPASALTADDMAALYHIRESSAPKIPISKLITQAVRVWCAGQASNEDASPIHKEAA